ncbi:type II secretion system minor pseudopilin GspK [Alcaligenaceae bacterium LF4-65]|uniref:Type II secretion system protein K n=1 Tax=Zwartia hollandica TaxID=324606 RepID=A0A953T8L2_9BURK|nr:type II secretion system minor pseudopilin GspK [Zwartia hollandica]MBZ1351844.1 type II secretion system minor pseudopilin GspK [Zwartia hollandica]
MCDSYSQSQSQKGSATLIALVVVSLIAICVSSLMWQQDFEIRKTQIYKENTQVSWLQRSLIDVVRLVLKIDLVNSPGVDHLGEIWALPIENSRVEDYLKNQDLPEELRSIKFSGAIQDAQALFNIANLWDSNTSSVNLAGLQTYANLLEQLGLNKNLADQTAQYVLRNNRRLQYLDELINIPGYSSDMLRKLSRFAIVLPEPTAINMNTTSNEILLALLPTLSQADAMRFIQLRVSMPLKSQNDITQLLTKIQPNRALQPLSSVEVKSDYWLAHTNMLIEQRSIHTQALIRRFTTPQSDKNYTAVLWSKQRIIQVK